MGRPMKSIFMISLAVATVLVVGGCKQSSSTGPGAAEVKAFETATPEVKQIWQTALEADHTNDYAKGLTLYYSLLSENLTPEQREAVGKLSTGLKQRMSDAAEKGDASAQAAVQQLQQRAPGRPR